MEYNLDLNGCEEASSSGVSWKLDNHIIPTPSQEALIREILLTIRNVLGGREGSVIIAVGGPHGSGKTFILKRVQWKLAENGVKIAWIDVEEIVDNLKEDQDHFYSHSTYAYSKTIEALAENDVVFFDDYHLFFPLKLALAGCVNVSIQYGLADVSGMFSQAIANKISRMPRKVFVISTEQRSILNLKELEVKISPEITVEDLSTVLRNLLPNNPNVVDAEKIHKIYPNLNYGEIVEACKIAMRSSHASTETILSALEKIFLEEEHIDLREVEEVTFEDLIGLDEVKEQIQINLITPLTNFEISKKYGLKIPRGILITGPPGTGKTSIGRILAHYLKGKFFLIDGKLKLDSCHIDEIYNLAKQNAPSIVFVDDVDLIVKVDPEVYECLLSTLDGVENSPKGTVCTAFTTANPNELPPSLTRSGRINLWLNTRTPNEDEGRKMTKYYLDRFIPPNIIDRDIDFDVLTEHTRGMTGADIRRIIEQAKNFAAYADANGKNPDGKVSMRHLVSAVKEVEKSGKIEGRITRSIV